VVKKACHHPENVLIQVIEQDIAISNDPGWGLGACWHQSTNRLAKMAMANARDNGD
jgi:hypothetical protein